MPNNVDLLRQELISAVDRWTPEVVHIPPRSTMRTGIAQKCYLRLDRLCEACVEACVREWPNESKLAVSAFSEGKPLARLSFGQRTKILEALSPTVSKSINSSVKSLMDAEGRALFKRMVESRNQMAHRDADVPPSSLIKLLSDVTAFCENAMIVALAKL